MNWYKSTSTNTYSSENLYPGILTQGEGIDFRQELHEILYGSNFPFKSPKGHWVVYRSYDLCSPSVFYSNRTNEGVGGPAYNFTDNLVRTRRVPLDKSGLPINDTKIGAELGDRYHYYFEYTLTPKIGDHIFELILNDHSIIPNLNTTNYGSKYIIKKIHDYRLNNGNIQYYIANCEFDEVSY